MINLKSDLKKQILSACGRMPEAVYSEYISFWMYIAICAKIREVTERLSKITVDDYLRLQTYVQSCLVEIQYKEPKVIFGVGEKFKITGRGGYAFQYRYNLTDKYKTKLCADMRTASDEYDYCLIDLTYQFFKDLEQRRGEFLFELSKLQKASDKTK